MTKKTNVFCAPLPCSVQRYINNLVHATIRRREPCGRNKKKHRSDANVLRHYSSFSDGPVFSEADLVETPIVVDEVTWDEGVPWGPAGGVLHTQGQFGGPGGARTAWDQGVKVGARSVIASTLWNPDLVESSDRLVSATSFLSHVYLIHVLYVLGGDSTYVQERPAQNFVQDAGLIGQGGSSGARRFLGKTPPKYAAEPRDCPCRPRAPQRVGVRVRPGVGLGWSGPTCKVEIDDTRPAQSFVQGALAHSGSHRAEGVRRSLRHVSVYTSGSTYQSIPQRALTPHIRGAMIVFLAFDSSQFGEGRQYRANSKEAFGKIWSRETGSILSEKHHVRLYLVRIYCCIVACSTLSLYRSRWCWKNDCTPARAQNPLLRVVHGISICHTPGPPIGPVVGLSAHPRGLVYCVHVRYIIYTRIIARQQNEKARTGRGGGGTTVHGDEGYRKIICCACSAFTAAMYARQRYIPVRYYVLILLILYEVLLYDYY